MALLNEEQINESLESLGSGWTRQGEAITKTFTLEDFVAAVGFVESLVEPAESLAHHPDISISWNRVEVEISTHSEGGLTAADFELAGRIEALG
jgi:4a-hydroxytetrahydrobiopterin dehydratase